MDLVSSRPNVLAKKGKVVLFTGEAKAEHKIIILHSALANLHFRKLPNPDNKKGDLTYRSPLTSHTKLGVPPRGLEPRTN